MVCELRLAELCCSVRFSVYASTGPPPMGLAIAYASLLPALVGPLNLEYVTVVAALFVIGLVFYFVSYVIQKSRGIPVDQMHRMIPPE